MLAVSMLVWTGCDSNEVDDGAQGEADVLVGVWNATSIKAGPIDVFSILDLALTLELNDDGTARIEVSDETGVVGGVSGTYTVGEASNTITLSGDDIEDDFVMNYTLVDENTLAVSFAGSDLADLGIDLGNIADLIDGVTINADLTRAGT